MRADYRDSRPPKPSFDGMRRVGLPCTATAGVWEDGDIEAGQALFNANCASCHKVTNEVLGGPGPWRALPIAGGRVRNCWCKWIQNPQGAAESGDGYIKSLGESVRSDLRLDDRPGGVSGGRQEHHGVRPEPARRGACGRHRIGLRHRGRAADRGSEQRQRCLVCHAVGDVLDHRNGSGRSEPVVDQRQPRARRMEEPCSSDLCRTGQRVKVWMHGKTALAVSLVGLCSLLRTAPSSATRALMRVGVVEGYKPNQPIQVHSQRARM